MRFCDLCCVLHTAMRSGDYHQSTCPHEDSSIHSTTWEMWVEMLFCGFSSSHCSDLLYLFSLSFSHNYFPARSKFLLGKLHTIADEAIRGSFDCIETYFSPIRGVYFLGVMSRTILVWLGGVSWHSCIGVTSWFTFIPTQKGSNNGSSSHTRGGSLLYSTGRGKKRFPSGYHQNYRKGSKSATEEKKNLQRRP